jgi:DNA-nicking Smr family endonuclease
VKNKPYLQDKLFPPQPDIDQSLDDEAAFQQAMQDVRPIPHPAPQFPTVRRRTVSAVCGTAEEENGYDLLLRALEGDNFGSFRLNEYIEGGRRSWDSELLRKLREGGFSVQAELDLHGFNQREAVEQLAAFVEKCCRQGLSCVRIIHGKGKNSPKDVPILKNRVQGWLSRRRTSRFVVAYTSARPVDGGGGALYVLLRGA